MTPSENQDRPSANEDLPVEVLNGITNGVPPLKAVREWRGHSIEDLARIAGVSEESIRGAEAGGALVLQEQLALAISLDVSADLIPRGEPEFERGKTHLDQKDTINEMGRKEVDQSHSGERANELGRKEPDRNFRK
jgi:DNA-binding XRE family transcriptional regulator